jgi:hypothetical protein
MDHRLWHALLHLATHAGRHLFGEHKKSEPYTCDRCSAKVNHPLVTCCNVKLCPTCQATYTDACSQNGGTCVICNKTSAPRGYRV